VPYVIREETPSGRVMHGALPLNEWLKTLWVEFYFGGSFFGAKARKPSIAGVQKMESASPSSAE
jgi:hypothetical protein